MSRLAQMVADQAYFESIYRKAISDAMAEIRNTQVVASATAEDLREAIRVRVEILAQAAGPNLPAHPRPELDLKRSGQIGYFPPE
jgi:hypothetical protein